MYVVVFVCTGNICRSPIAEGLLKYKLPENLKDKIHVLSAGTHASDNSKAMGYAIKNMKDKGLDISLHASKCLDQIIIDNADLVLVMEYGHIEFILENFVVEKSRVKLISDFKQKKECEEINDPFSGDYKDYCDALNNIDDCIDGLVEYLKKIII